MELAKVPCMELSLRGIFVPWNSFTGTFVLWNFRFLSEQK